MNRRDWLTGVVTSVIGAQMVIAAKNAEAVGSLVLPNQEVKIYTPSEAAGVALTSLLGTVYCKQGKEYFPIGRVHRVEHWTGKKEAGRFNDPRDLEGLPEKRQARGEIDFFPELFERMKFQP